MVRAKFTVTRIAKSYYSDSSGNVREGGTEVFLHPQYDTSIEEDKRFSKATPSGEMRLLIDNPPAADYLKPGRAFYVDFTIVPIAEPVPA